MIGAERFLKEIEVTANLQHPNILPLYDSGRTGGSADGQGEGPADLLYYVMPHLEGQSLPDKLTREKQLWVVTPFDEYTPRLSPDGRWLAYGSLESGRPEVYVSPFPNTGSAKRQVSTAGGTEPTWSRSGRELFYKNGRTELMAAAVLPGATFAVGEQRILFSTAEYHNSNNWRTYDVSPDGRRFVMIRPTVTGDTRDELIVVENFFEELKAKVKR